MVPPNGRGRQDHSRQQQAARADDGTPPKRRIGRGAEVLKGNRRNVRVAGRLANARQSAAIFHLFQFFFLFFMSSLSIFVGAACHCSSLLGTICFHEVIYRMRTPAGQTGPKSTLRSRIQHAEIHRDETSRASILQSTATSSRGTGSRSHLHLGRKRGIGWFPIS